MFISLKRIIMKSIQTHRSVVLAFILRRNALPFSKPCKKNTNICNAPSDIFKKVITYIDMINRV